MAPRLVFPVRRTVAAGFAVLAACLALPVAVNAGQDGKASVTAPGWTFDARLRLRSEFLEDSFRLVAPAEDHLQLARLELGAHYQDANWLLDVELQDSRAWGFKTRSPVGTDDINVLEPINASVGRRLQLADDGSLTLRVGRMTIDYGSRRLLARNQFRNTSNAFQGLRAQWQQGGRRTQLLYTLPLQREPNALDPAALRERTFALDKAGSNERFWGLTHDFSVHDEQLELGAYAFANHLSDRPGRPVADRDLITVGARALHQGPRYDLELEAAYQWGDSLPGVLAPAADMLSHRAWFAHAHLGFDLSPQLELRAAFDIATGDRDPDDGRNERFDRLYGARAFELGPSGIFGAAIRSNLRAPALRLVWTPSAGQTLLLSHRWLRLDSARDALVSTARRDFSGESGRDVGEQWELRWQYKPQQAAFSLELGGAYLDKGAFFAGSGSAGLLNPPATADSRYLFAQLIWRH